MSVSQLQDQGAIIVYLHSGGSLSPVWLNWHLEVFKTLLHVDKCYDLHFHCFLKVTVTLIELHFVAVQVVTLLWLQCFVI